MMNPHPSDSSTRQVYPLESSADLAYLELHQVEAANVTYQEHPALQVIEHYTPESDEHALAILTDSSFQNGVIEVEVVGDVMPDAPADMRGFVGIAFHVQPGGARFECFFLRPTNGRADDQLRRNHATQYIAHPEYPWYRLREEHPGVYESYTDLQPGVWTKVKIVVSGIRAQLYVNGADQPCLIVNDLKLGEQAGQIALWVGRGTVAHFSSLTISPA